MLNQHTTKVAPKAVTVAPARTISLKLQTMTIQRAGLSNFLVVPGSNHCGPADQLVRLANGARAIPVRWNVAVECEPQVDARGFLFDQAMLGVFVDRIAETPTALSCELLARNVAERLIARLEKLPHCKIRSLKLEFSPNPYAASITVLYA
jgi:hypothetical protein